MDTTKTKTTVSETMTATTTLLHVLAWVIVLFVLFVLPLAVVVAQVADAAAQGFRP